MRIYCQVYCIFHGFQQLFYILKKLSIGLTKKWGGIMKKVRKHVGLTCLKVGRCGTNQNIFLTKENKIIGGFYETVF